MSREEIIKVRVGNYRMPITLIYEGKRIFVKFGFNRTLISEVKTMEGARWHGFEEPNPRKIWSIANSQRNHFQLEYLQELNPYAPYDVPLLEVSSDRPLYDHQLEMKAYGLTYHYVVLACEMGTGKTLAALEVAEESGIHDQDIWYVGPIAGIRAVDLELLKWGSGVFPKMMTYDKLVTVMGNWEDGQPAPKFIILDESSKVKNPQAQRSQAAKKLVDAVRDEHDREGYALLMSGTPSPKSPVDWWHQCEIACPGFIKEGTQGKFRARMSIIEQRESVTGGMYPHHVAWLDDDNKCAICGEFEDHTNHDSNHEFEPSKNEVAYLAERLKGLVLVKLKKDCTDLPEIQYEIITIKSTPEILRTAKLIARTSKRAAQTLTLLRELSDGFQYKEVSDGTETCPACHGDCEVETFVPKEGVNLDEIRGFDEAGFPVLPQELSPDLFDFTKSICDFCGGAGTVPKYHRAVEYVGTPKDEAFINELDMHEDIGRYIVWGGFTATVDRLIEIAHRYGWTTLKVDGRGYAGISPLGEILAATELLTAMDQSHPRFNELLEVYPKLCFVGHPKAGGMALTLTASPTELFYSNDFDGEARMQAEARFHRLGMDINRGATVKDLIHLKTDLLVLENLKKKKKLQALSMGDIQGALNG